MPSSLPVPSKAALRTLRNLALGTSCTVSFTAGLLTEDRRRRIHSLREVHDNAKKLKSSRSYHSAGTTMAMDMIGEQVMQYADIGAIPADLRHMQKKSYPHAQHDAHSSPANATSKTPENNVELSEDGNLYSSPASSSKIQATATATNLIPKYMRRHRLSGIRRFSLKGLYPVSVKPPIDQEQETSDFLIRNRQWRLASDLENLLDIGIDADIVDAAVGRLLDVLDEGLEIPSCGIENVLVKAAARLSQACRQHGRFEDSEKIIVSMLDLGPIDESCFHLFKPWDIIEYLLRNRPDYNNLRKAATIYLATFKDGPGNISAQGLALGRRLCAETCEANFPILTEKIYSRLFLFRGTFRDAHLPVVKYRIISMHQLGKHRKVIAYFLELFGHTQPTSEDLSVAGDLAIDSAILLHDLAASEEVMTAAFAIAEERNLRTSSLWILKVLGNFWRASKDIARTRALFDRHEHIIHHKSYCHSVYSAMIQFCIEAGNEEEALMYHKQFEFSGRSLRTDIRTCGHLALAKAMRDDWDGVNDDLRHIASFVSRGNKEAYGATFVPIFKEFVKTHELDEVEEFLRFSTVECKVPLTKFLSLSVVNAYAKNGEIRSLARWLEYVVSVSSAINAMTCNIILTSCHKKWGFDFKDCVDLYRAISQIRIHAGRGKRKEYLVNDDTISVLRDIALVEGRKKSDAAKHVMLAMIEKLSPAQTRHTNYGRKLHQDMSLALSFREPAKVLELFDDAVRCAIPLHPSTVSIAVKASIALHQSQLVPTFELLQSAQKNGYDITQGLTALILFRMAQSSSREGVENTDVAHLVEDLTTSLESRQDLIPFAVTHAAHVLVCRGRYRQAIELWRNVSYRQGISLSSISLATVSVLLRAYIGIRDSEGLNWVIEIMESNHLIPDAGIYRVLKRANYVYKEYEPNLEIPREQDYIPERKEIVGFRKTVADNFQRVKDLRAERIALRQDIKSDSLKIIANAAVIKSSHERNRIRDQASLEALSQRCQPWNALRKLEDADGKDVDIDQFDNYEIQEEVAVGTGAA